MPIVLDVRALDGVGIGPDVKVSLHVENVQLRTALNLLTRQQDLVFDIKHGAIRITTPEESEANLHGRLYPVAGLVDRRVDYSVVALANALAAATDPDNWEDQGGPGAIDELGGVLLIYTTLDNHEQIERVLEALRKPPPAALASYPVGLGPDSVPLPPIRFYPIADLLGRYRFTPRPSIRICRSRSPTGNSFGSPVFRSAAGLAPAAAASRSRLGRRTLRNGSKPR